MDPSVFDKMCIPHLLMCCIFCYGCDFSSKCSSGFTYIIISFMDISSSRVIVVVGFGSGLTVLFDCWESTGKLEY